MQLQCNYRTSNTIITINNIFLMSYDRGSASYLQVCGMDL